MILSDKLLRREKERMIVTELNMNVCREVDNEGVIRGDVSARVSGRSPVMCVTCSPLCS